MGPHRRSEDRLLEGRELPAELAERFKAWGISRQESDSFRDRLWGTCPTGAELTALAEAKNPWAELAYLEDRPHPPRHLQARPFKSSTPSEDEPLTRSAPTQDGKPEGDRLLQESKLPPPPTENPSALAIRAMGDRDLLSFYEDFRKAYHLDSPFANPTLTLDSSKLEIYEALTNEVKIRRG
ncbi:MAG: hypothetical protein RL417_880 [Pseudomonadota bacterium]